VVEDKRNLSLELRPRRFSEVIGYGDTLQQIRNQVASGRVPTALLFGGEFGSGKTTLARIVAISLQCTHSPFGEPCDACLGEFWDIQEINASELNGVNEMRTLVETVDYMPQRGRFKVIILDEAHRITEAAQNLLLKHFEEAHSYLVWMICTTEPHKILKALRSRCLMFTVGGIYGEDVRKLVSLGLKEGKSNEPAAPLADALIRAQVSSPRLILMATEKFLAGESVEKAAQVSEPTKADVLGICRATIQGNWSEVSKLLLDAAPGDGRQIRIAVAGYFRSVLLKTGTAEPRAAICADAIDEIIKHNVFEDGLQLSATAASLFKVCSTIATKKRTNG
jgi:DNA polymerase III subunit gamma/tau